MQIVSSSLVTSAASNFNMIIVHFAQVVTVCVDTGRLMINIGRPTQQIYKALGKYSNF